MTGGGHHQRVALGWQVLSRFPLFPHGCPINWAAVSAFLGRTQTTDFLPFGGIFRPAGRKIPPKEIKYHAAAGYCRFCVRADKIIPKAYLTHADRRATLWLDFRLSTRRYMMTAFAHNLIGPADTLEAALF